MANAKKTDEIKKEEKQEATRVKVTLPILRDGDNSPDYVTDPTTGVGYLIQRGEEVEVPVAVANNLKCSEAAILDLIRAERRMQKSEE